MKIKNGFTLIELLAVIVILAIIAVITVPLITNMIEQAKKGSIKDSAYGYMKSIDNFHYSESIDDSDFELGNKRYTSQELKNLGLKISGEEPESNSWVDIVDNEIIDGCLQFGNYMVYVGYDYVGDASKGECDTVGEWSPTVVPTVLKTVGDTTYYDTSWIKSHPIYYNPVTNAQCNSSASNSAFGTSSGCMKWYAYSETNGRVNMLLDHNITNEEWNTSNNQSEPSALLSALDESTSDWSNRLVRHDSYKADWTFGGNNYSYSIDYSGKKARLLSAEEVAAVTENSLWAKDGDTYYFGSMASGDEAGYYYQNASQQSRQESFSWLFNNMHECDSYGCDNAQEDVVAYWTSTPKTDTENEVWCVCNGGCLDTDLSNVSYIGIRPVISVSKSTVY
ncbi:MAG: prepilin-type N-terminal cleavage/methylation domain-containing protein [Bacilli bacterium]